MLFFFGRPFCATLQVLRNEVVEQQETSSQSDGARLEPGWSRSTFDARVALPKRSTRADDSSGNEGPGHEGGGESRAPPEEEGDGGNCSSSSSSSDDSVRWKVRAFALRTANPKTLNRFM